jgi:hypothetical protein
MLCLGIVVVSSVDFELAVTMARAVGVSCAPKGRKAPESVKQVPRTNARPAPRFIRLAIPPIFMIPLALLLRFPTALRPASI